MRFAASTLLLLIFTAPDLLARTDVLIFPPAWESSSLKRFARDMDENCEDLIPAIKNANGYCATSALSAEIRNELVRCKGKYSCLKKKARAIEEYDIIILSSLSKKKNLPRLKVSFYNTRGDLLYNKEFSGERGDGPEEVAALYLSALRNTEELFSKPANKQEMKETLRRGFAFYKKGDRGGAIRFFEKAGNDDLAQDAREVNELIERAAIEMKNGDFRDAMGDLQNALEKDENIRKAGYAVISYIREMERTKRSEFDNDDFYEDILKIHSDFEHQYRQLDRKRNDEERKIAIREQKAMQAIEREIEQLRKELEKKEEKINRERATLDDELKRLLEKQEKDIEALNKKKEAVRQHITSLENGRNEFADKVERRADELKNKELEKLQAKFLKSREVMEKKILALERKDPPNEKEIKAVERQMATLESDLDRKRTALNESYRRGAEEHLRKYDRKIEDARKQLGMLEKKDSKIVQGIQKKIDRKEKAFKNRVEQWHKERKKREKLIAALDKNREKRIAAARRDAQVQLQQVKKQLNGEKEKIVAAEKEKISKRYSSRFKPTLKRVIERTAATKKIYTMLSVAYAHLGDRSLRGDDLPEARRHYHHALYYDSSNKQALKGVDLIRRQAVKLYETAMAMSDDEPDSARRALETIINCLNPTNPVYVRSFVTLKELSK